MRSTVVLLLFALSTAGCSENQEAEGTPRAPATARTAVAQGGVITGTVRERIPVAPYVYVRLETSDGDVWAAVNEAPLTVGSTVTVYNVLPMEGFASKTLDRTFERIYFGSLDPAGGVVGATGGAGGGAGGAPAASASDGTPPAEDARVGPIARASGAGAHTIGELWAGKHALAGKPVSVRGVVVKYNPAVMGKNWIHLQDGSGSPTDGTHDLTVTSLDEVAVGDTVTVTGTARTNQDLGAGYSYPLIVEDAKVAGSTRARPSTGTH